MSHSAHTHTHKHISVIFLLSLFETAILIALLSKLLLGVCHGFFSHRFHLRQLKKLFGFCFSGQRWTCAHKHTQLQIYTRYSTFICVLYKYDLMHGLCYKYKLLIDNTDLNTSLTVNVYLFYIVFIKNTKSTPATLMVMTYRSSGCHT